MIRIGIIGLGNMGRNHLRVLSQMHDRATVTAIVDPSLTRNMLPTWLNGMDIQVVSDLSEGIDAFDAAIIAAPTSLHHSLGMACLRAGKHVLIEKPLASSALEGEELVAEGQRNRCIIQVGHIERFNPAVKMMKDIVGDEKIVVLEANRLSYFMPSDAYGNLIIDLMIHDIDIATSLFSGSEIIRVSASAHPNKSLKDLLHVHAQLEFDDDRMAILNVSRLAHEKARNLKLYTLNRTIHLDYITREIHVSCMNQVSSLTKDIRGYRIDTRNEYFVADGEPLYYELEHFLTCIETGSEPEVNGEAGLKAMQVAFTIINQCRLTIP